MCGKLGKMPKAFCDYGCSSCLAVLGNIHVKSMLNMCKFVLLIDCISGIFKPITGGIQYMNKKKDKIFTLLVKIAENMKDCGEMFCDFKITSEIDLGVFSEKMKDLESRGDTTVHETMVELNHALITPIDQEDILVIAENMDTVVDCMEEASAFFYLYNVQELDKYMEEFRKYIKLCTYELFEAINLLADRKVTMIKKHTVNVKTHEEACDTIERTALRELFANCNDPIEIIKMKDIYSMLEDTVDTCQNVAKVLDSIVMKNA